MEEKLIETIKLHPCLFDKSSILFRNKMLKERAWQAAAISTGASVEQCKQRWKSLRDRFVREVAALSSKSEAAAEEKTKWCYLKSMRFLTKHVTPRKTRCNTQLCIDDQPSSSNSPAIPQSDFEWVEILPEESRLNDSQNSIDVPKSKHNFEETKRQRLGEEEHERLTRFCETIETMLTPRKESRNKVFLAMLDELLQKKSDEVQDRLKMEILNHVHNS